MSAESTADLISKLQKAINETVESFGALVFVDTDTKALIDDVKRAISEHRNQVVEEEIIMPAPQTNLGVPGGFGEDIGDDPDPLENPLPGWDFEEPQPPAAPVVEEQGPTIVQLQLQVHARAGVNIDQTVARNTIDLVLPSIVEVTGPLAVQAIEQADEQTFVFTLASDQPSEGLSAMLRDGFNANIPHEGSFLMVTSRVGTEDDDVPVHLPVEVAAEVALVEALDLTQIVISYERHDGRELTEDQVATIIEHPISQGGLARLGTVVHMHTQSGPAPYQAQALFRVTPGDDVSLAQVATGVAAYRGSFNFGQNIGMVTASAQVVQEID